jgi:hypothetical protein
VAKFVRSDQPPNDGTETSAYLTSMRRGLRRERRRRLVAFMVVGALLLGTFGAAVGPIDGWDGAGWLPRMGFFAVGALGGAVTGFRLWSLADRGD